MNQKEIFKMLENKYFVYMIELIKQLIIYTLISFIMAIVFNLMGGETLEQINFNVLFVMCFSITLSFVVINHVFLFNDKITHFGPLIRSLIILVDVLVCTFVGLLIARLLFGLFWGMSDNYFFNKETLIGAFVIGLIITVFAFTYFFLKEKIERAQETIHNAEKEKILLAKLKAESDLEALQGKLNPHFLFNSLNSIASLIQINPADAEMMTLKLSELFRSLIDNDIKTMHTVDEEFEILETYLAIEKIRFGKRLEYKFYNNCPKDILIPKLILQPLVENSIKHVIALSKNGGKLSISAECENNKTKLIVSDSGSGLDRIESKGYGIQHIEDRLKMIYDGNYKMEIDNDDQFKFIIILE